MSLTKEQRNAIFRAVAAGKLDPASCRIEFNDNGFDITHKPTRSYLYAYVLSNLQWFYTMAIGTDPETANAITAPWDALMNAIQGWATEVVRWGDTPDLWEIRHDWTTFSYSRHEETANTPFTPEEQEAISGQLAAIRENIKETYALTAEQESKIDDRFDEAEKASKRLGRKDWILLFGGAVFSLILADAITPDIAQHILMMTVHGLEHLFTSSPARSLATLNDC